MKDLFLNPLVIIGCIGMEEQSWIQNKSVSAICWACLSLSTMHPLHLLFNFRKLLIERTQIHWQLKGFGYSHPLPTVPKTCDRYCKVKLLNVKDKLINLTILLFDHCVPAFSISTGRGTYYLDNIVVWPLHTCIFHLNRERDIASDVTLLLGTQEQCSHHP
jgi:hypothetical protein